MFCDNKFLQYRSIFFTLQFLLFFYLNRILEFFFEKCIRLDKIDYPFFVVPQVGNPHYPVLDYIFLSVQIF